MNFSAAIATTFSNIKTSLRSKLSLFISGIAVIALLAATAQAILLASGNTRIKLNPQALTLQSSGAQTADERTLEQQTASALFDRDTTTVHTAYGDNLIDIKLEKLTEISDVRFYGAAEFQVQVQSLQGGLWTTIPGLNNIKLANQPAAWNTYTATQSTTTDNIRFILTPNQSGNTGGGSTKPKKGGKPGATLTTTNPGYPLPEIEIWGKGEHTLVTDANALIGAMKSTPAPAQARQYTATPVEGVIGATGHSFKFTLNQPARNFKRAYLAYETFGVTHWVSPVRRINGKNLLGGAFIFAGKDWTPVVEPIHPDWLLQGSNTVEYTLPTGAAGTYSVRNVRAILELDDGNSLIQ